MHLSSTQQTLHQRALDLSREHRRLEALLIQVLKEVDNSKLYKLLNCSSLFTYAVQLLGLSESIAYSFISVARKSDEVRPLLQAIEDQKLSVAKASRIVSALTKENACDLIQFAQTHTLRETDFEVARLKPEIAPPDKSKPISENLVQLQLSVSKSTFGKLKRAQSLLASKESRNVGFDGVLDKALT